MALARPSMLFIAEHLNGFARNKASLAITAGLVKIGGKAATDVNKEIAPGTPIEIDLRQEFQ